MATAISFLDNFPVKFNNENDSCLTCDTRSFCQLAEWGDRFEFAYHPSSVDIPVTNGTFTGSLTGWTAGAGWAYNAGKARITNNTGELYQFIPHFIGKKYKVSFDVSNYSGTGSMTVYFGATASVGTVSANGTYSFYITPTTADELGFLPDVGTFILDLDNVTLELMNDPCGVKLYNTETGLYSSSYLTPNLSNAATDVLGFSYLWSAFGVSTEGCYEIHFFDGTGISGQMVQNGTFAVDLSSWTATGAWAWNSNKAKLSASGSSNLLKQFIASMVVGKSYTLTFDITGFAGNGYAYFLTDGAGSANTLNITADGSYSMTYIYTGVSSNAKAIGFAGDGDSFTNFSVDNVSVIDTISCCDMTLGSNEVINGTFDTNLNNWTTSGVIQTGGKARFNSGSPFITQAAPGSAIGVVVKVTFDISNYISGNLQSQLGTDVFNDTVAANGSYVFYFTTTILNGNLVFSEAVGHGSLRADIDNITMQVTSQVCNPAQTECYNIKTDQGCTTKLLKWTNGYVNGFNYPYYYFYNGSTTGFQYMRVESDIRNSKYKGEEDKYIDSAGNNKIYYSSSRKQKEFIVGMMPEYMHDALSIGLIHKEFYIDGVRYTFEDTDYLPEWSSDVPTILAQVKILIGRFMQNLNQID